MVHRDEGAAPLEPRRSFVISALAVLTGSILALVPAVLGLFSFLDPFRKERSVPWKYRGQASGPEGFIKVASLEALPVGGPPQRFVVVSDLRDSWNYLPGKPIGAVFLQRTGEEDVRCFHATCPHAGCSVSVRDEAFHCPCHNSAFQFDGTKLDQPGKENPSPRPLDDLQVNADRLAAGEVWVKFENYYTGIAEKKPKA